MVSKGLFVFFLGGKKLDVTTKKKEFLEANAGDFQQQTWACGNTNGGGHSLLSIGSTAWGYCKFACVA